MPNTFLKANLSYLAQATSLIEGLNDVCYAKKIENFHGACVGAHIRHCLDHYDSFLNGLSTGEIDYDARPRNAATEINTQTALKRLNTLQTGLKDVHLDSLKGELLVKMDCGVEATEPWVPSSISRELQFLVSHTVHHFAIVAAMLKSMGHSMPSDFGVAPSTIAHQAAAS